MRNVIRGGAASGDLDWGYVEKGRALEPEVEVLSWSLSTSSEPETRMEGDVIVSPLEWMMRYRRPILID